MALDPISLGVAATLVAGRAVYRRFFSTRARVRRELAEMAASPITRTLEGLVHVAGQVQAIEPLLQAPLTQRACVAYELEVDVLRDLRWRNVIIRRDAQSFVMGPMAPGA